MNGKCNAQEENCQNGQRMESVEGVTAATINLVFEPEWEKDMMSEEAKLELGFL